MNLNQKETKSPWIAPSGPKQLNDLKINGKLDAVMETTIAAAPTNGPS